MALPSPFRFNTDTHHKRFRSGAHPNQMKQIKMILKAQEMYFELYTSAVHRYEDVTTNDGQQDGTPKLGCLGTRAMERCLPARRSS